MPMSILCALAAQDGYTIPSVEREIKITSKKSKWPNQTGSSSIRKKKQSVIRLNSVFPPTIGSTSVAPTTERTQADVGAKYTAIRNAVQSVRLPPELTVPDSNKQELYEQLQNFIDQTPEKDILVVQGDWDEKGARMLVKTGKASVDPSAMTTRMREDSHSWILSEDGPGVARMDNTTTILLIS